MDSKSREADGLLSQRRASLERTIDGYRDALRIFTAEADPIKHAQIQYLLGNAYAELPVPNRAVSLGQAIACYEQALRSAIAESDPALYAMTQTSLGNAYAEFPLPNRTASLARAITCYEEALRFATPETDPAQYARTLTNLGNAYLAWPAPDPVANLNKAIAYYQKALRFATAEASPRDYTLAQFGLGNAYWALPTGDRPANLDRAIACYQKALRFATTETAPVLYATIQSNLGNAYWSLRTGDRPTNLGRAIACFGEALRFRTAETVPAECRLTAGNLGRLHLGQRQWAEAQAAYDLAIRAGELLYRATGSETGRQAELEATGDAVAADAYCLSRLGRYAEAVQRLEAGRARALGEALDRNRAALEAVGQAEQAAFAVAVKHIKTLEAEGRRGQDAGVLTAPGRRSFAEWSAELVRARRELTEVIERIRGRRPGFLDEGLNYPEIATTAQPTRPLVYLLTTSQGGLALLVTAGAQAPRPDDAIWLDDFTTERLGELFTSRRRSGQVGGYLVGQLTGNVGQLAAAVTENLAILHRDLIGPLADRLAELEMAAATIIPVGQLSLLPLPAAAPDGVTIALAPSARTLRAAKDTSRTRSGQRPVLLAAGNPLPPPPGASELRYSELEVRVIERFFAAGSRQVLLRETATGPAIRHGLPEATHLHLACHGGFDLREPLNSALHLAREDRLTLRDLLDGDLDLSSHHLAVLSACQTGITEFQRVPDEVVGLAAGFLQAGVPAVVATLWPVVDESTAVLMAEFYRQLFTEGKDPAAALDAARRYLRDITVGELAQWFEQHRKDPGETGQTAHKTAVHFRSRPDPEARPYAHPVYWAGFVYFGP